MHGELIVQLCVHHITEMTILRALLLLTWSHLLICGDGCDDRLEVLYRLEHLRKWRR